MSRFQKSFLTAGCLYAFLGVAFGAFGAHALKEILDENSKSWWQTATFYQLFHALALMLLSKLSPNDKPLPRLLKSAGILFITGIFLFSGSLFAMALTQNTKLGMITPLGGLSFLAGWLCVILYSLKAEK